MWLGGLVVLGAIVAPTVFGIVPAPSSADAMTVAFRRFDRVAITCAAAGLVAESVLAGRGGRVTRLDLARGGTVLVAAALAITTGAWISPTIEGLHRAGAVRGSGDLGMALERTHRLAEAAGKAEVFFLLASLVLLVARAARREPTERTTL